MLSSMIFLATLAGPAQVEIAFKGHGGIELPGTLLLPTSAQRAPAVLLLPGSGPSDRDGNQPPTLMTDLLKQLAEALQSKGIATLRFDKRAAHTNARHWPKDESKLDEFFAFEAFEADAKAALDFLRTHKSIDPQRVGIAGHSEGGLITASLASKYGSDIKAIALLGTAGRKLDAVLVEQVDAILLRQKASAEVHKGYMAELRRAIEYVVAHGRVPQDVPQGLRALFPPGVGKLLRSYFTLDPTELLTKYSGSALVLQGELDVQISGERDFPLLVQALKKRPRGHVEGVLVKAASHNLKAVSAATEPGFTGPVVPEALDKIVAFLVAQL
ncbi:MAG TPA: alpha/beta fold hydrolase [Fimbriimonadaceae bacterium]|nr:alpha/beta fold hydrolase [Fimbriimonadaceae bacterium]